MWPTRAHAGLFAEYLVSPDLPTVLIYGHVDVQPVDPLHLWTSPPFEPRITDGKIWARGADDNKGQHYAQIVGIEAALKGGGELPVNVKFILESDEEHDGEAMAMELPKHKDKLACDVFVVSDSNFPDRDHPAVTLSLRGIQAIEVTIKGASGDKHSGEWGGMFYEPIDVLRWVLQNLKDFETGRVLVPGFYDDVDPPTPATRAAIAQRPWKDDVKAREQGVKRLFHEEGYTPLESGTLRPTLQVNGIQGGYTGEGFKTVIGNQASAKISTRLVAHQDPEKIFRSMERRIVELCGRQGYGGDPSLRRRAPLLVGPGEPVRPGGVAGTLDRVRQARDHARHGGLHPDRAAARERHRGTLRDDGIRAPRGQPACPRRELPHRQLPGWGEGRGGLLGRGRGHGGGSGQKIELRRGPDLVS